MSLIREIEECSLNAWPAPRQMVLDGWLLRFAAGYTRRANSVNPLYPGTREVRAKVALCEQVYGEQGLRCVFRLTPLAHPPELDGVLARLGYRSEAPTSVQVLGSLPQAGPTQGDVRLAGTWETQAGAEDWLAATVRLNGVPEQSREALRGILGHIAGRCCYAAVLQDGHVVACGLGVLEGDTVGLFDLVTDAGQRGRGHGTRLVTAVLAWAQALGARRAYLQVMLDNAPALRLYRRLGFGELYRYWYRVK